MSKILLGFNCNCFTNRFDEPEVWTKICKDLGIHYVMFNIDLIDPNWSWNLQKRLCDETLNACEKNNVTIKCSFGGQHSHRHYLGHPDAECRREAEEFFRKAMRQTAYLGGESFGTCFAIFTQQSHYNKEERKSILDDAVSAYYRLADYGLDIGLQSLTYEMTSVPRESCATFEENDFVLARCSEMKIPMKICLDLGHRYLGGSEEEKDHLAWIRRYGKQCSVIDCQQTDFKASRHWPFTRENNQRGIIDGEQVFKTIMEYGAEEVLLAFELRTPAFFPHDDKHLKRLEASVKYWRKWITD